MFRKIHSKRDPSHTLARELRRELQPYFAIAARRLRAAGDRYPRLLFAVMVMHIIVSAALMLTVFSRKHAPVSGGHHAAFSAIRQDMQQLSQAGAALKETMSQKRIIDSITAKSVLSKADSMALERALDKLTAFNKNLIHLKK